MLLKNGKFEDAASRAYYSAFHAAQAVLLTEGLTATTHRGLLNLFGLHFTKTNKINAKFGKLLSNLKDDREHSDYEIYSFIDEETAKNAVQEARLFHQEMKTFLKQYLS